jgi:hypothetical protein
MSAMIAAVAFALTLGAPTSPALSQEDGLSGGQIILVQDQGKGKKGKKKGKTSTTGTSKCGNGVIDAGEQCDGAAMPSGAPVCGPRRVGGPECTPTCTVVLACELVGPQGIIQ